MDLKDFTKNYIVIEKLRVLNEYSVNLSGDLDSLEEHEWESSLVDTEYETDEASRYFVCDLNMFCIAESLTFNQLKEFIRNL